MRERVPFKVASTANLGRILLICVGMAGCANHAAPAAAAAPAAVAPQGPVIVRLVGRNYSVVISAGPKAPVYTVRDGAGQLLALNLTLEELRLNHSDLYDKLAPAISPHSTVSLDYVMFDGAR